MFKTKYYIKYSSGVRTFLLSLFFLCNTKLNTEVIIDRKLLLVTELNKFGVKELLHSHKRIWPSYVTEFPFQTYVCLEEYSFCIRKILIYCLFFHRIEKWVSPTVKDKKLTYCNSTFKL